MNFPLMMSLVASWGRDRGPDKRIGVRFYPKFPTMLHWHVTPCQGVFPGTGRTLFEVLTTSVRGVTKVQGRIRHKVLGDSNLVGTRH